MNRYMRWLLARAGLEIRGLSVRVGYEVRPYDSLADRRRWRWRARQRCGLGSLPPGVEQSVADAVRRFVAARADRERDDLIDQWHDLPETDPRSRRPLHEFLGMSWAEYKAWVEQA